MLRKRKGINVEIGFRLRAERLKRGFTQENFAEALDVSVEHYRKIESGAYGLNPEKIVVLYRTYQIDPADLLLGEKKNPDVCPEDSKKVIAGKLSDRVSAYGKRLG